MAEDLPLFTAEALQGRFADLWELAETFQKSYENKTGLSLKLNLSKLYLIIISTYDDITRYKFYHLSNPYEERSDAIKRASYLTKWVIRFKPWHVVTPDKEVTADELEIPDDSHLVNEMFAVSIAITNLNMHCGRDFFLSDDKWYELIYDLMYRTLSDDALMLIYKTFVDHVSGVKYIDIR